MNEDIVRGLLINHAQSRVSQDIEMGYQHSQLQPRRYRSVTGQPPKQNQGREPDTPAPPLNTKKASHLAEIDYGDIGVEIMVCEAETEAMEI